jgi:hypothetical protein
MTRYEGTLVCEGNKLNRLHDILEKEKLHRWYKEL